MPLHGLGEIAVPHSVPARQCCQPIGRPDVRHSGLATTNPAGIHFIISGENQMKQLLAALIVAIFTTVSVGAIAAKHEGAMKKDEMKKDDTKKGAKKGDKKDAKKDTKKGDKKKKDEKK
jgi:mannitol-specific phosphotransferase system IIBC component